MTEDRVPTPYYTRPADPRFAELVRDTSNDPHLVREAERLLASGVSAQPAPPLDPWHPEGDCLAPTACGVTGFYCSNWRAWQPAPPLDVERLAEAMGNRKWAWLGWVDGEAPDNDMRFRRWTALRNAANELAAEYVRLGSTPSRSEPE